MFRLHKQKSAKSGERFDFKFSNLQAVQVPNGWDKLFVSLVSVETGKSVCKSNKAPVRGGTCKWTDSFSESVWISQEDASEEVDECPYRLVVAMGSSRSGILGEGTVDLASYISFKGTVPLSLPLKKCNYGTILQVKIQCSPPKTKVRNVQRKTSHSYAEDGSLDFDELENQSDISEGAFTRSVGSSSSNQLEGTVQPGESYSRETSFSAPDSRQSFDSVEGSFKEYSPRNGAISNPIGRQDSYGSQSSSHGSFNDQSRSNHASSSFNVSSPANSLQNHREDNNRFLRGAPSSPLQNTSSSKELLEAPEVTIEELRAEARMWEQNARKLMIDVEKLQKELLDQSKLQSTLEVDLSASRSECDGLKRELQYLKGMLDEALEKQTATKDLDLQGKDMHNIQKELDDEIKFQREENANLAFQLKKTQEANIELVSILQELEDTVEKQKREIDMLSRMKLEPEKSEMFGDKCPDSNGNSMKKGTFGRDVKETSRDSDMDRSSSEHSTRNWEAEAQPDDKRVLELQLQELQESHKKLESSTQLLEKTLEDKNHELQIVQRRLAEKEEDVKHLELKLSEAPVTQGLTDASFRKEDNLVKEVELLRMKAQELEKDCSELTDENLELLFKLKELQTDSNFPCTRETEATQMQISISNYEEILKDRSQSVKDLQNQSSHLETKRANLELQVEDLKDKAQDPYGERSKAHARVEEQDTEVSGLRGHLEHYQLKENEIKDCHCHSIVDNNSSPRQAEQDLRIELLAKMEEVDKLKYDYMLKKEELEASKHQQQKLETEILLIQKEKGQLEEDVHSLLLHGDVMAECLNGLQDKMVKHNSEMAANKTSELESCKHDLEVHLSELEEENLQLSERLCGLEAQLRYLTDAKESNRLELQNTETTAMILKDDMRKLEAELEAQKSDMRQKLEEMQKRWFEAQEECHYLKIANPKLQATTESLIEECSLLQKTNAELRRQKVKLHEQCMILEAELKESEKVFSNMSHEIQVLEEKYSTMMEEIDSKEKALSLELEALHVENREYKEKVVQEESLLNQMYLEKSLEVDNLQKEVTFLTEQISATQDDKDKTAGEALLEVSHLRADKSVLEAALRDVQGRLNVSEARLSALQNESQAKVMEMKEELAAAKQNQEVLMADHGKLLDLLEDVRSNEERLRNTVRGLELKLKASEYEKVQLAEEISSLKVQLQKTAELQDEILALKRALNETKSENERLEASLQILTRDYEELHGERTSFVEKLSDSQKALSELEDCKRKKVALEEKVLRLQGDLTAREALGTQEAALKNELAQIRRENSKFQRKVKHLEEEKEDLLKRARSLEQELKRIRQSKDDKCDSKNCSPTPDTESIVKVASGHDNGNLSTRKQDCSIPNSQLSGIDLVAKLQSLENQLGEALEANDMYKAQVKSLLSEGLGEHPDVPNKSTIQVALRKDLYDRKVSLLETELRELRERYFHMSLKYAEVEAQREQLVLKLKAATGKRNWFK